MVQRKFGGFSTPSVKQVSDFFMYLYQDLNRLPSTIDGSRTAILDTLGPLGLSIAESSDLNWEGDILGATLFSGGMFQ